MKTQWKMRANWIWYLACAVLTVGSALAVGRSLIIGMDSDEQYAVALAYRIARGDLMIREVWDPHQTSAILPALLIRVFRLFVKDNTCLLLYLRTAGVLFQATVSFLWYRVMEPRYGRRPAFLTALVLFHTLPKWIVTPEFANQQLLFWILTILCLYRYEESKKLFYCILAGVALCFTVLAYPSCALLFLPCVVWLGRRKRQAAALLTVTCAFGGGIFLASVFSYLKPSEIGLYLKQITGDPYHSAGPLEKLARYGREALELSGYLLIYLMAGLILYWMIFKLFRRKYSPGKHSAAGVLALFVLCAAAVDQIRQWAFGLVPAVHPQLHYLVLYVVGGILYHSASQEKKDRWSRLYTLAWLPSLVGYGAVLLLTNLDLKASFVHLLPGMLAALLFWCDGGDRQEVAARETVPEQSGRRFQQRSVLCRTGIRELIFPILWVLLLIGARGYLVRVDEGIPENVFCVKQKVLYGAAKNIYCPYMVGYQNNSNYVFIEESLTPGTRVLCISSGMQLVYLMNDMEICSASLISTPVYDQRYLDYYELNPHKLPEAVIIDKGYLQSLGKKDVHITSWLESEFDWENRKESEFLWILERR